MSQPALSRRRLFQISAAAAAAWQVAPWTDRVLARFADAAGPTDDVVISSLEAFSDTLIPGVKRSPDDRAVAGAASGPGAVQAGAVDLMQFPPAGIGPALPGLVAYLNSRATAYAVQHGVMLDPTVPPFVSLSYADRTALALELLDESAPDYLAWFALAAMPFLAYNTAAHLHTYEAVRAHHAGLKAIGFPQPNADNLWRFPDFSYGRALASEHPGTTSTGSPP